MDVYTLLIQYGLSDFQARLVIIIYVIWTIFWKSLALWACSKNNQKRWFIAVTLTNTVGILEMAYLFRFAKKTYTPREVLEFVKHPKI